VFASFSSLLRKLPQTQFALRKQRFRTPFLKLLLPLISYDGTFLFQLFLLIKLFFLKEKFGYTKSFSLILY